MFEKLKTIENIKIKIDGEKIEIENVNQQKTFIEKNKVKSTEFIFSAMGDKGVKINFINEDFLIVSRDDFVFKIRNFGLFNVENLPEIVTFEEVIENAKKFIETPEPNNNFDNTVAFYLRAKTLLENAEYYNFDVTFLKNKVRETALRTNAISDLSIYD